MQPDHYDRFSIVTYINLNKGNEKEKVVLYTLMNVYGMCMCFYGGWLGERVNYLYNLSMCCSQLIDVRLKRN